ncbi:MAG: YigZ family protein [Desulfotignum sp.]|nr:YigZ family protein [Desulfotignum sp.]
MFTCHLSHAASIAAAKEFISKISKENKTATHNCWAYIVGDAPKISQLRCRKKPSNTQKNPCSMLTAHNMTQVAAVVTGSMVA